MSCSEPISPLRKSCCRVRKVVPKSDVGAALSVLDVLNSAVGILSPLYGGMLLGRLGVGYQPHISCAHYLVLFSLVHLLIGTSSSQDKRDAKKQS